MSDSLKLLGIRAPIEAQALLSAELRTASEQLAAEMDAGGLGMLFTPAEHARIAGLALQLLRWSDRAEALESLVRPRVVWWRRVWR